MKRFSVIAISNIFGAAWILFFVVFNPYLHPFVFQRLDFLPHLSDVGQIDKALENGEPEREAQRAIRNKDFRFIVSNYTWSSEAHGVICPAGGATGGKYSRYTIGITDFGSRDSPYATSSSEYARRYNTAIVQSAEYLDYDLCWVAGEDRPQKGNDEHGN